MARRLSSPLADDNLELFLLPNPAKLCLYLSEVAVATIFLLFLWDITIGFLLLLLLFLLDTMICAWLLKVFL